MIFRILKKILEFEESRKQLSSRQQATRERFLAPHDRLTEAALKKLSENPDRMVSHGEIMTEMMNGENLVAGKPTYEHANAGKHNIELMMKCCEAELKGMELAGQIPAPYYFERVAILSRKEKNYRQEIDYCEKYINAVDDYFEKHDWANVTKSTPEAWYGKFKKRLPKAKALLAKSEGRVDI